MPSSPFTNADRLRTAGAVFACIGCFFTPLSTSLLGLFSILAALSWLLSGSFSDLPEVLRRNRSTLFALLLFCFMTAAISYSEADQLLAIDTLKKYRELLLFPVFMSLFRLAPRFRQGAEYGFLAGCIVLMLISYLMFFGVIEESRYGHSLVYHITHSFFMAVLSFWALHKSMMPTISDRYRRYAWLAFYLAAVINIFYIAPGRTGMFVFCCLMLLFFYQRFSLLKWLFCMALFFIALVAAYQSSDNFSSRIQEAVKEIRHYEPGQSRTSIGQRFDWWTTSIVLIKEKPFFGHGTGSYSPAHLKIIENTSILATDNPHNEYLFLGVQFGMAGLSLFFILIISQFIEAKNLGLPERYLLQGVVLALLSGSLMNSLLFDSQQGHFYLFMSCALLAAEPSQGNPAD